MTAFSYHRSFMAVLHLRHGCPRNRSGATRGRGRSDRASVRRPEPGARPIRRSETGRDLGEGPVRLSDAGAVRDHTAAGAAPVAVDRPEREAGEALAPGVVADPRPGVGRGGLLLVAETVHAGD